MQRPFFGLFLGVFVARALVLSALALRVASQQWVLLLDSALVVMVLVSETLVLVSEPLVLAELAVRQAVVH